MNELPPSHSGGRLGYNGREFGLLRRMRCGCALRDRTAAGRPHDDQFIRGPVRDTRRSHARQQRDSVIPAATTTKGLYTKIQVQFIDTIHGQIQSKDGR